MLAGLHRACRVWGGSPLTVSAPWVAQGVSGPQQQGKLYRIIFGCGDKSLRKLLEPSSSLEILKNTADVQGLTIPDEGRQASRARSHQTEALSSHLVTSGANPSLFSEGDHRGVRNRSPSVCALGAEHLCYISAPEWTPARSNRVLTSWRALQ